MATITINIPNDKLGWVMDGFALRFGYEPKIDNPNFDAVKAVDPIENPLKIDNPETLPQFSKRMLIHIIKSEANTGHNQASMQVNADIANGIELD